jgi:hypothetical protein
MALEEVIQSLWVSGKLSPMEHLSISSYLRHGHEFHLYTYEPVDNIPPGTIVKDANSIIPSDMYDPKDFTSLALFSDFFRYKLLLDCGGWWSDTDAVCMHTFDFDSPYVFSSEDTKEDGWQVNGGTIKAPKNSDVMAYCWRRCLDTDPHTELWGVCGPTLIAQAVKKMWLVRYVQAPHIFCSVPWWMVWDFKDLAFKPDPLAYAVHLWNAMWIQEQMDKSLIPTSLKEAAYGS